MQSIWIPRKNQTIPEVPWRVWLIMAGRGFGKTRTGAEAIKHFVNNSKARRIALIAASEQEAKDIMIWGESGLYSVHEDGLLSLNKGNLCWRNGTKAFVYGGNNYNKLRGSQFDLAWIDELAKFRSPEKLWDQLMFTMRLGQDPKVIVTTTPRPCMLLKKLQHSEDVFISSGSTYDNASNLPASFLMTIKREYDGTILGQQEIYGQIIDDQEALWKEAFIEIAYSLPKFTIKIIAVDPSITSRGNDTGIIAMGLGDDNIIYILHDYSLQGSPIEWCQVIINAAMQEQTNIIVAEVNQGGELIRSLLHNMNSSLLVKTVRAIKSKRERAIPIVALYARNKVRHAQRMRDLEAQMLGQSHKLDRLDALVWGVDFLFNCASQTISIEYV